MDRMVSWNWRERRRSLRSCGRESVRRDDPQDARLPPEPDFRALPGAVAVELAKGGHRSAFLSLGASMKIHHWKSSFVPIMITP
jgi:hypothetical protein